MFGVKHGPYSNGTAVSMKWANVHIKFLSKYFVFIIAKVEKTAKVARVIFVDLRAFVASLYSFNS